MARAPEELHILSDAHTAHAAGDTVIVSHFGAHQIVAFVLNGGGTNGNFRTVLFEIGRQLLRPKHRQVRFGSGTEIIERVQDTEGIFRHQRPSVHAHAADRLRHPGRIAREQLVIFLDAHELDDSEFHDELIDEFLRLPFGDDAVFEVAFDINIEESAVPADRHCSAVLVLYRGQISEIQCLNGLFGVRGGLGNVFPVNFRELFERFERLDLFG